MDQECLLVDAIEACAIRDALQEDYSQTPPNKRRAPSHRPGALFRLRAFEAFRLARDPALARFAAFELLRRRYRGPWWEWPAAWRNPDLHRLAELQAAEAEEVGFFTFVQWIADQQLARCCEEARTLKLPIGLYLDIAVGVRPDGFDAWSDQGAILPRLSVGAPPDPINTAGQNWGLGCRSAGRSHAASSIG
jgi:4-alpha-glucanotransferase